MVPFTRFLCGQFLVLLVAATFASAQDRPPSTPSDAAQLAAKKTDEWNMLASALDQKITRLLPCDPHVRADIDEVARASDARFTALNTYWQEIAKRSRRTARDGAHANDGKPKAHRRLERGPRRF